MMNSFLKNVVRMKFLSSSRLISTSPRSCKLIRDLKDLKEIQKQFQKDDGLPVYLKKGDSDRFILGVVYLGLGACTVFAIDFLYTILSPPSPPE